MTEELGMYKLHDPRVDFKISISLYFVYFSCVMAIVGNHVHLLLPMRPFS